ncbi:hypothetical protein V6N13_030155 [Hibiscus sabdariffa]|uniref:Uncharacterized protein n=2 Tax=Hibiscus sabdariffa TaxID=183260 RepID=A0ABR2T8M0_9ROSI
MDTQSPALPHIPICFLLTKQSKLLLNFATTLWPRTTMILHRELSKWSFYCGGVGILGIAWAFGGMIFILVYRTAGISGAICGCGLVKTFQKSYYNQYGGGANSLAHGYSVGTGLGAEIAASTFVLVYTVFSATDPKRNARDSHIPVSPAVLAPLPIGFAVFMVHLATIPITGTGINPARSFGAAVIFNQDKIWDDHWIFWVGTFIGAAIAAIYHQFILRASAAKATGFFRSSSAM